jgi:putative addiction module component (TIGR02574 family)
MEGITPEASQILERALDLSTQDRGALIARLIASLDDDSLDDDTLENASGVSVTTQAGVDEAWAAEIKRRVDDLRSGKARLIPEEEVRRRIAARLRDGRT